MSGKRVMIWGNSKLLGWLAVFLSAFCFYLATAIIRWSSGVVEIAAPYYVFARFALGFIVVLLTMALTGTRPQPRNYHLLLGRMAANSISVYCFYQAVVATSVAEANILNMSYPIFGAIFSWFLVKEQRDVPALFIVAVATLGVWLVLSPGEVKVRWENLWGLCSGISGAAAILYLNVSRRYHDSQTILFFMFGLGAAFMLVFFRKDIFWPNGLEFVFLFTCSAAGVLGQYLLTYGFYYVTAVEGAVISSSRILVAAMLGPVLVADPPLTLAGWLGALLIFAANGGLAWRRATVERQRKAATLDPGQRQRM